MSNARGAPIDLGGGGAGAGCVTIALPRLRVRLRWTAAWPSTLAPRAMEAW